MQAADRRQSGATSTPPSLPASGWRRDLPPLNDVPDAESARLRAMARPLRRVEEPVAPAMVLAPIAGLLLWCLMIYAVFW